MKWYKGYMKILKVFSGLLVLLIAGWWFASPYWVLYQVKQAVEENQLGKLSSYIDYPAVRQSLKSQLSQYLEQKWVLSNALIRLSNLVRSLQQT